MQRQHFNMFSFDGFVCYISGKLNQLNVRPAFVLSLSCTSHLVQEVISVEDYNKHCIGIAYKNVDLNVIDIYIFNLKQYRTDIIDSNKEIDRSTMSLIHSVSILSSMLLLILLPRTAFGCGKRRGLLDEFFKLVNNAGLKFEDCFSHCRMLQTT